MTEYLVQNVSGAEAEKLKQTVAQDFILINSIGIVNLIF